MKTLIMKISIMTLMAADISNSALACSAEEFAAVFNSTLVKEIPKIDKVEVWSPFHGSGCSLILISGRDSTHYLEAWLNIHHEDENNQKDGKISVGGVVSKKNEIYQADRSR